MTTIDNVYIGEVFRMLDTMTAGRRVIFITDRNVERLYRDFFADRERIVMDCGEKFKTLSTVERLHTDLLAMSADRHVFLVGMGGGIVTDTAGFVASTYMRGVDFGFVATTLVAQVDASVGGKNGVNLGGYKNIVGTFRKPSFVLCDPMFLSSLPERELRAAMGEVIKCALIASEGLLSVTDHQEMVMHCVAIKNSIVNEDFMEQGRRKLLNLGHTFGHSLEKCTNGERYLHGEAVAIGLGIAARISERLGLLAGGERQRIEQIITSHGLQTHCPSDISPNALIAGAMSDKKRHDNQVDMILLEGIGRPIIKSLTEHDLTDFSDLY